MSTAVDWDDLEVALHDEIVTATGLSGSRVIWNFQGSDRPSNAITSSFVSLQLNGIDADWNPDYATEVIPMASAPTDLKLIASVPTVAELTVQVFSTSATGQNSARSMAERISKFFDRESTVVRLDDAGIAVLDRAPVQAIPAILETKFESRAVFTIRVGFRSGDEEITTYIETVDFEVDYT
jgi:hypothetical protein